MSQSRRLFVGLAVTLMVFGGTLCLAEEPTTPPVEPSPSPAAEASPEAAADDSLAPGTAGMVVTRDAATGKLRPPTAAEAKALAKGLDKALTRSSEGLKSVRQPNGAITLDLKGRFQSMSLVRRNADGTVSTECVTDTAGAEAFLMGETTEAQGANDEQ